MPRSRTHAETVADATPEQPRRPHRATGRPKSVTTPEVAAIEARVEALFALTDCVDFEAACVVVEAEVLGVLERAVLTHTVGCSTIRRVALQLARVQRATVAHLEHLQYAVIPACACEIAEREAALADRKAA